MMGDLTMSLKLVKQLKSLFMKFTTLRNQDMISINLSGGFMRSEKGTLAKFEYKEGNKNNLFDKLIYPITQNIASHILVLLTGFIIGLISSGKLYKLIQLLFHL